MLATKSNSYTFQKDSIWYFSRRVPADLRRHYRTGRIAYSLRTKSIKDARVRAMSDSVKLDRHWHILRISCDDLPGKHLLTGARQASFIARKADGILLCEFSRRNGYQHTLTVWQTKQHMMAYRASNAHKKAMRAMSKIGSGKVFGYEATTIPSWEAAFSEWDANARMV